MPIKTIIMGAAGRDFHNFNTFFRPVEEIKSYSPGSFQEGGAVKKSFIRFLIANLIAILLGSAALAAPELKELSPGVFAFVGGDGSTNSGFIVTGEGVVVIDTQGPAELDRLLKEKIKETTDKPVTHVINTHYHGDHTFGNQYFAEAVIIAHENARRALIDRDEAHRAMFARFFGEEALLGFSLTLPGVTFNDRMTLRLGGRTIELVHPWPIAHTDGDIFVWLPAERVVFAGDHLYNGRLPLLNDGGTAGALKALDLIALTDASVLVPGHGRNPRRSRDGRRWDQNTARDKAGWVCGHGCQERIVFLP